MPKPFAPRLVTTLWLIIAPTLANAQLTAGEEPPQLLGKTRQGQQVSVADYQGKVLAISFWASWCAPCQIELPMLEKLQRVLGPEKLRVIAINIEDREQFRNATRPMFDWQSVVTNDPYKDAYKAYKGSSIPYLLIVSRGGKVRQVFRGYSEESVIKVVSAVADAVNE